MKTAAVVSALAVLALCGMNAAARQPDAAPTSTVQQIAELLERGDFAGAQSVVDVALREFPSDPALHNYAGVIAAQGGAVDRAEFHFQTAIRIGPEATAPYENLGRLYQEQSATVPEALQKALAIYERLLAIDSGNVEGLYQSAYLRALSGRFLESRALIQRLPNDIRQAPHVLAVIAVGAAGAGDTAGASAAIEAMAGHHALTATDIRAVLPATTYLADESIAQRFLEILDQRGFASVEELHRLGRIHAQHGRFENARAALERAASAGGPTPSLLLELARTAVKLSDYKGALGYLAHARSLEPDNATVHFLFGMVCVELDLGGEAYESLRKAVTLAPEHPQINYAMGAVAMTRHDPSEALPYLQKYVALMPADPRGRFVLGAARFRSKLFDEARVDLQAAAAHSETAAGSHFYLAQIARQMGDLATARREIDASLRGNANSPDAWAELGFIQTRAKEYEEAERSLMKALSLDPENYAATVNLATLFSRTRDPRREAQAARLAALQEKRAARAQEFLRMVEVIP